MTRRSAARDPSLGVLLAALAGRRWWQQGEEGDRACRRSTVAVRDRAGLLSARMRSARRRRHSCPVSEALGAGGRQSGGNGEVGGRPGGSARAVRGEGRRGADARLTEKRWRLKLGDAEPNRS